MPLPLPNLDDRRFDDLVREAKARAEAAFPAWTDLSPHDPGMVLVEVFAHLTELMLYRLNRVPDKAYVAFLNLMGVTLYPPVAAAVDLTFARGPGSAGSVVIPAGTRVTTASPPGGGPPPVFRTVRERTLDAGEPSLTDVRAVHAELADGELVGLGTGLPSQVARVGKAPIVASTGDDTDLIVRVEIDPADAGRGAAGRGTDVWFKGKVFRQWAEAPQFAGDLDDPGVYLADRNAGTISFSPQVRWVDKDGIEPPPGTRPAVPPLGREIRVWYRYGGGGRGNVKAGTLTSLVDKVVGIGSVTNDKVATGGQDAESLANARVRGPQQIHALDRAVTTRDYEFLARRLNPGTVSRAKAVPLKSQWSYATAGTVQVLLVPDIPTADRAAVRVTADLLQGQQTEAARSAIFDQMESRRPIGTDLRVDWVRYKTVGVTARLVVQRGADGPAIQGRVENALYRLVNPLPTPATTNGSAGVAAATGGRAPVDSPGWPFGESLRASHVYDIALAEPGVNYVDNVSFTVADAPADSVTCLAADAFQPRTFYAGARDAVYRTVNNGDGWELLYRTVRKGDAWVQLKRFDGETVTHVEAHPEVPGWLAVATTTADQQTAIYLSDDCGETWGDGRGIGKIRDMAWVRRSTGEAVLLVVDAQTLYSMTADAPPQQVGLTPTVAAPTGGYWAVAACTDGTGRVTVAVATNMQGVYVSRTGGAPGTFALAGTGLTNTNVRYLAVDPDKQLWAGLTVLAGQTGEGTYAFNLNAAATDWRPQTAGWNQFGSCNALAFEGKRVYAATFRGGVVRLNMNDQTPAWQPMPGLQSLPPVNLAANAGAFQIVNAVAFNSVPARAAPTDGGPPLLACGQNGVFRSVDHALTFEYLFKTADLKDRDARVVTLPETWLFCSGSHNVTAVTEDDAR